MYWNAVCVELVKKTIMSFESVQNFFEQASPLSKTLTCCATEKEASRRLLRLDARVAVIEARISSDVDDLQRLMLTLKETQYPASLKPVQLVRKCSNCKMLDHKTHERLKNPHRRHRRGHCGELSQCVAYSWTLLHGKSSNKNIILAAATVAKCQKKDCKRPTDDQATFHLENRENKMAIKSNTESQALTQHFRVESEAPLH